MLVVLFVAEYATCLAVWLGGATQARTPKKAKEDEKKKQAKDTRKNGKQEKSDSKDEVHGMEWVALRVDIL